MTKYLCMHGGPALGYKAYGPFETEELAHDFGEAVGEGGWHVMPVHHPSSVDYEEEGVYPWSGRPAVELPDTGGKLSLSIAEGDAGSDDRLQAIVSPAGDAVLALEWDPATRAPGATFFHLDEGGRKALIRHLGGSVQ